MISRSNVAHARSPSGTRGSARTIPLRYAAMFSSGASSFSVFRGNQTVPLSCEVHGFRGIKTRSKDFVNVFRAGLAREVCQHSLPPAARQLMPQARTSDQELHGVCQGRGVALLHNQAVL